MARARAAQASWSAAGWRARRAVLESWWRILSRDADRWADLIRSEIGKPRIEAMGGDVLARSTPIRWTVRHGGRDAGRSADRAGLAALAADARRDVADGPRWAWSG